MKKIGLAMFLATGITAAAMADSAPSKLDVKLTGIEDGQPIASTYAYCMPDGKGGTKDGSNISPGISWLGAPANTKSFAIVVVDPDVPASFDSANKEGKTIAADFPRQNFYHWVLVDILPTTTSLEEGQDSKGIVKGGKPVGKVAYGVTGQNNYPGGGYDGPCPPWNDERLHHYHFTVYALDVMSLGLSGNFTGKQAQDKMAGHILAEGEAVGTYTQNPKLLK